MSRESNKQPEASPANTFHSGGGSQSTAQGEQAIGTQINNYGSQVPIEVVLQLLQEKQPQPVPPAKNEPQTVVVDVWHRGDFATITEALKAVKPGARILVRPGVYEEGIVLDKPVEIIGDGPRDKIVIESSWQDTVFFKATVGRLANLTLRRTGNSAWSCVKIVQGRFEVEDCDISSQSDYCVEICGSANPTLRRNRIHNGEQFGIVVYGNGQGTLEGNDIFANWLAGIIIKEGGNPTLRRNRIHDGNAEGVIICKNGQGTLEDNEIVANWIAGVEIKTGGNPTLRRNTISKNNSVGIVVSDTGGGIFEDNDLRGNTNRAWKIEPDCEREVQRRGNKE